MITSVRGAPGELESERLLLRAPDPAFGPLVAAGIDESFEELRRFMDWAQERPTAAESTARQRAARKEFLSGAHHSWLLFRKTDEAFVGFCGLPRPRWDEATLEIGYWLRTSKVGRGYMTEAVERVTRLCFEVLGARRVEIQMSDQNLRSVAVAERAGYRWVATRHGETHPDGSPRTTRVYVREAGDALQSGAGAADEDPAP